MNTKVWTAGGVILFLALSLADLCLTWVLIEQGGGRVRESNPIASAWLARFGWDGLALFKLIVMAVLVVTVVLLSRKRPRAALVVMVFACLAVGLVVLYSYNMLSDVQRQGPADSVRTAARAFPWPARMDS